jgi:uncharacterized glyoxalase superfamily protein PhnB
VKSPSVFPFLRYEDAAAAMAWLQNAFGFEEHMVHRDAAGAVAHAELRAGQGMVMLGSAAKGALDMKSTRALGGSSHGVYVVVSDPDAHYARARRGGAEVVRPLADTGYGGREYTVRDYEGNFWSFGTYQPFAQGGEGGPQ